jgi:hypothetical protein
MTQYWKITTNTRPYEQLGQIYQNTYNKTWSKKGINDGGNCQIECSLIMTQANIPIKDWRQEYSTPYWHHSDKTNDKFIEYSKTKDNPMLIKPTQMIDSPSIIYCEDMKNFDL